MARMAFKIDFFTPIGVDLLLGFSWGAGGVNSTSVFTASALYVGQGFGMATRTPVEIPDGFPGLVGNRIFLDIMGSCAGTNQVDVDFKIYRSTGGVLLYQAPTTPTPVWGLAQGLVINTDLAIRGGVVGAVPRRQFLAGVLNLITPAQTSAPITPADREKQRRLQECLDRAGRYESLGPGGGLGRALGCLLES